METLDNANNPFTTSPKTISEDFANESDKNDELIKMLEKSNRDRPIPEFDENFGPETDVDEPDDASHFPNDKPSEIDTCQISNNNPFVDVEKSLELNFNLVDSAFQDVRTSAVNQVDVDDDEDDEDEDEIQVGTVSSLRATNNGDDASQQQLIDVGAETDSEDEWNYVRGDNNKENLNPTGSRDRQSPEAFDEQQRDHRKEVEEEEDAMSQLNPNAAEFVPISPTHPAPESPYRRLNEDLTILSHSPKKPPQPDLVLNMANLPELPNAIQFEKDISSRPHDTEEEDVNGVNGKDNEDASSKSDEFHFGPNATPFSLSKASSYLDQSQTSTRVLFGDDSFQNADDSIFERTPANNDPMSMSFHQDMYQTETENVSVDLNKVQLLPDNLDDFLGGTVNSMLENSCSNLEISKLPEHFSMSKEELKGNVECKLEEQSEEVTQEPESRLITDLDNEEEKLDSERSIEETATASPVDDRIMSPLHSEETAPPLLQEKELFSAVEEKELCSPDEEIAQSEETDRFQASENAEILPSLDTDDFLEKTCDIKPNVSASVVNEAKILPDNDDFKLPPQQTDICVEQQISGFETVPGYEVEAVNEPIETKDLIENVAEPIPTTDAVDLLNNLVDVESAPSPNVLEAEVFKVQSSDIVNQTVETKEVAERVEDPYKILGGTELNATTEVVDLLNNLTDVNCPLSPNVSEAEFVGHSVLNESVQPKENVDKLEDPDKSSGGTESIATTEVVDLLNNLTDVQSPLSPNISAAEIEPVIAQPSGDAQFLSPHSASGAHQASNLTSTPFQSDSEHSIEQVEKAATEVETKTVPEVAQKTKPTAKLAEKKKPLPKTVGNKLSAATSGTAVKKSPLAQKVSSTSTDKNLSPRVTNSTIKPTSTTKPTTTTKATTPKTELTTSAGSTKSKPPSTKTVAARIPLSSRPKTVATTTVNGTKEEGTKKPLANGTNLKPRGIASTRTATTTGAIKKSLGDEKASKPIPKSPVTSTATNLKPKPRPTSANTVSSTMTARNPLKSTLTKPATTTQSKDIATSVTKISARTKAPIPEKQTKDTVNKLTASRSTTTTKTSSVSKSTVTKKTEVVGTKTTLSNRPPLLSSARTGSKTVTSTVTKVGKAKQNGSAATVVTEQIILNQTEEVNGITQNGDNYIKDNSPVDNKLLIETAKN